MRAKKLFALSALIFFTSSITASVSFYGKLNFSYENEDSAEESNTDFVNNASRIGIKGNFKLNDKYSLIFQAENEIDPTDGNYLISDWGNNRIQRFDSEGNFIKSFAL